MSQRIRGQEVTLRVAVDGQTQRGSFFKVTEFTITARTDLPEEDFIGELESDIDIQHHGFDMEFTVQHQDQAALDFLSTIVQREQLAQQHPNITITVTYTYRGELGAEDQVEVYHDVFLKPNDVTMSGRKEYVTSSFMAKCKRRSQLPASA
jgi:hypothetical protein